MRVLPLFLLTLAAQAQIVCVAMPPGKSGRETRSLLRQQLEKRRIDTTDCGERKPVVGELELNWYPQPFMSESTTYLFMATAVPAAPDSAVGAVTVTPEQPLTANGYIIWLEENGRVLYREERAGQLSTGLKHVARYLSKKSKHTCIVGMCVNPPKSGRAH